MSLVLFIHISYQHRKETAMESLIFLTQKKDGTIKARACANGSVHRKYIPKQEASSPLSTTKSLFINSVIDTKQNRDILTADIPNAFVQKSIKHYDKQRIIMKI